jgi:hypothetical protein
MLRDTARYAFGLPFVRFMPLNDDYTIPVPSRVIGGAGPFDFSSEPTPASINFTSKIDNGDAETVTIDLSGAVSISAVTVDELVDAINLATPTDVLASEDVATGRLKIVYDGTDTPDYLQIYGPAATLAFVGQGKGVKFVKSDTIRTMGDNPIMKDEEVLTTTDAKGLDTSVISDGYRKGVNAPIVDTAEDWELLAIIEGGVYDSDEGTYDVPTSEDDKIYFYVEAYYSRYTRGENKEADLVSYVQKFIRTCKGTKGDGSHERNFADGNYTITATSYKDENEVLWPDTTLTELTIEEYEALDVENV